jgi:quercetin dioxygenase-like cupin family protein
MTFDPDLTGRVISPAQPVRRDVFGPTIEILTTGTAADSAPALLRGTVPTGVVVPMHAHGDPETFVVLAGQLEGLVVSNEEATWLTVDTGQVFHVPPNARHALRNTGPQPAVALIVSTPRMAEFFDLMGIPLDSPDSPRRPPTPDELDRMLRLSAERGYWNATPEENAAVGIELPPLPPAQASGVLPGR